MLCFLLNQCCFILQGIFFPPNSFVLEALIYVQYVLYSGIEIQTRILAWLRSRQWFLQGTKYGAKMVNAIFAYQKTGGVNITMQNGHLPPLQIYSWVLTILQHIYRGQICENQFFVQCTSVTSSLLVRTSTVTTVSKKVTMITSSYYLLLSPLR